ncbi:hypothetical protein SAMN02745163_00655 [Clostridium cavendishii DSM 21758]|uniref:DUF5714 domain-containing protein n=1 Tax=Clostridium cavendishii DSM 21758 TaxID=1121302 RepID=A0A1M6D7P7_9CLOT|nr:DUF5714 domain-containing protein [Clostridium cavendishii]SHI69247.1 hypothetical protein SAMN02745163_00655 [Clostridium cavendishii DSM 21758]
MITGKCLTCNGELEHYKSLVIAKCSECGAREKTYIMCKNGHYLCNTCASKESIGKIFNNMFTYQDKNPLDVAEKLIKDCGVCGNSPHPMTTAAFLVAYKNLTNEIDEKTVMEGVMRATQIPGGWCGYFGACGAAIGLGVAFAIIKNSTPMSNEERSLANLVTSKALESVSIQGGPRCCTSSVRVSLEVGCEISEEYLGVIFPKRKSNFKKCWVSSFNDDCRKERCTFFNNRGELNYG